MHKKYSMYENTTHGIVRHMFSRRNILIICTILFLVLFFVYYVFFRTVSVPWEADGRFVLAVRTVPGELENLTLGFGIDKIELHKTTDKTETATILARRISLEPGDETLHRVLDTRVPSGEYSGLSFTLTSPELRNAWQENDAPDHISLIGDTVKLTVPFYVQEDTISSVVLAFETIKAVHDVDGIKKYLPVIQIETRSDIQVIIKDDGTVEIFNGKILQSATFGMDWDGNMRRNYRAKKNAYVQNFGNGTQTTSFEVDIDSSNGNTTSKETINPTNETSSSSEETSGIDV